MPRELVTFFSRARVAMGEKRAKTKAIKNKTVTFLPDFSVLNTMTLLMCGKVIFFFKDIKKKGGGKGKIAKHDIKKKGRLLRWSPRSL
jgi:hypothetical protein